MVLFITTTYSTASPSRVFSIRISPLLILLLLLLLLRGCVAQVQEPELPLPPPSSAAPTASTIATDANTQPQKSSLSTNLVKSTLKSPPATKSSNNPATITNDVQSQTGLPTITSSSAGDDDNSNKLPTLTGDYTIVAPSVPPTQNAPFMKQSSLPEGTVFIVVGAILGFLAVTVLAWRMGVAWCLHRSVKKAAYTQSSSDTKAIFRTTAAANRTGPNAPFYKYSDRGSSVSLSGLGGVGGGIGGVKGGKKVSKPGPMQTSSSNAANLFFSPTAGANLQNGSSRGSNYFPAGYYAAGGASASGNGSGQIPLGGPAISLTNLSSHSQGFTRTRSFDPSPPDSPMTRSESQRNYLPSTSALNLTQTNGGSERAPSTYLDDLFDGEKIPQPRPNTRN